MDAAFVPSKIVVHHLVTHKFTLEFGPTVTNLGKPIRNLLIGAAAIYLTGIIARISLQAVLSTGTPDQFPKEEEKLTTSDL
jgi:hypothetical protein